MQVTTGSEISATLLYFDYDAPAEKPSLNPPLLSFPSATGSTITTTVCGNEPTGAPAGFSLQWKSLADYSATGWTDAAATFGSASFVALPTSRFGLNAGECAAVVVGGLMAEPGASWTDGSNQPLACDKVYAFRAFAHANTAYSHSDYSATYAASTGGCPFVADAGPDQIVNEDVAVALDGSSSIGQGALFFWEQIGGPPVTLSSETSATATFVAPSLAGGFGTQTLTFRLTVTSRGASLTDLVNVTVRNINHEPVAQATGPARVNEGSPVTLNGSTSYDPDGDLIATFSWEQIGGPPVELSGADTAVATLTAPLLAGGSGSESLVFRLTVSDGSLSGSDQVTVTAEQVNHAPTARAGPDQTRDEATLVALDGTESSDPDGDPIVTFSWSQIEGPDVTLSNADTATPTFTAPEVGPGGATLVFRLTVSDGALSSTADGQLSEVAIQARNVNDAPSCASAQARPSVLWPPNHKLVPIAIVGASDPNGDPVAVTVTRVTQDEPVHGSGDGDTTPDAVIRDGATLLRSERQGTGNGRVYRIEFTAQDGHNGSCAGAVTVVVPISMKAGQLALDEGTAYDSTQP